MPSNGPFQLEHGGYHRAPALMELVIVLLVGLLVFLSGPGKAQASQRVFKSGAQFNEQYTLPFELHGRWKRTRFIQKSSSPNVFKTIETGEWDIRQVDDMVALTNPANGMRAMATITNIDKDTVTLSLKRPVDSRRWCQETLALTPHKSSGGQHLTGQQTKACYKGQSDTPYFYASAYVKGEKASALDDGTDTPVNVYNYLYLGE